MSFPISICALTGRLLLLLASQGLFLLDAVLVYYHCPCVLPLCLSSLVDVLLFPPLPILPQAPPLPKLDELIFSP